MNHKLIIAASAAFLAAAASAFVYVRNEMNSMDDIFMANVEALVQNEGTAVSVCYMRAYEGEREAAQFCDYHTTTSMLYPCSSTDYSIDHKGATSYCTK